MFPRFLLFILLTVPVVPGAGQTDAVGLYREKRYPEAQAAFEQRVHDDPHDAEAHFHLGRLALARQRIDESIPHFEQAVRLEPDNAEYHFQYGSSAVQQAGRMGTTFSALGLVRRGRIAMEKAVELAPTDIPYRLGLVEFYSKAPIIAGGGMRRAYIAAETIRPLDERQAIITIAGLKIRDREPDEAMALLEGLIKDHSEDYQVLYLLGRTAVESESHLPRGIAALETCLDLTPPPRGVGPADFTFLLGEAHARLGNFAAARTAYEASLEFVPDNPRALAALDRLP